MNNYNVYSTRGNSNNNLPVETQNKNTENLEINTVPTREMQIMSPQVPQTQQLPRVIMAPPGEQAPQTVQSTLYTPGFLSTQIGKMVRVEFLMGSGTLIDRIGTLTGVGASYILLNPIGTADTLLCDIYSIKFVTVYIKPL